MSPPPSRTLDSRTDLELIAALNGGEAESFDALYWRHRDWVVNLAFRFTKDHALALDVLQETFLYLLRKFPGFTLTCELRSFLYPAVRNLALAARRKAIRLHEGDAALEDMVAPLPAATGDSARESLAQVVSSLAPGQREVLLLRFVDGLALDEIADALEIPLGTVKSRLHHALQALRADEFSRRFFEE